MSAPLLRRRVDGGLLGRMLDDPELAPALRALPASALRRVILRVGLEDAGELIALASLEQLRDVFDEDLWRSPAPGADESFDAARFAVWLEVLLEVGEAGVADRLAEMSEDFLVLAFSRLAWVLDVATLEAWAGDPREAERLDRIVDARLCQELDAFLLVARSERGWDALWAALLAIDERHPQLLREVLGRCAAAAHEELTSAEALDAALAGDERLLEDARAERDARRAERGYVAPSDARAFLALARSAPDAPGWDPVTRAHFRERASAPGPDPRAPRAPAAAALPGAHPLRQLLLEAGVDAEEMAPPPTDSRLRRALAGLLDADPHAHQRVIEELAYLANALIAGDASRGRPWRPAEAAERAIELCDDGLRRIVARAGPGPRDPCEALARWGAVGAFRFAWAG